MESIGFELRSEAVLKTLTLDVIKSSEIEGQILNPEQVRSLIARRLGMKISGLVPFDRNVDGVVDMTLDATRNFNKQLYTKDCLAGIQIYFRQDEAGCIKLLSVDGEMVLPDLCKLFQELWGRKSSLPGSYGLCLGKRNGLFP